MEIIKEEDETKGRLVARENDVEMGEMTYSLANKGQLWIVNHTGVKEEFKNRGIAKTMFFKLVEILREEGKKVMPLCPFVKAMFKKHTELWDVLRHQSL